MFHMVNSWLCLHSRYSQRHFKGMHRREPARFSYATSEKAAIVAEMPWLCLSDSLLWDASQRDPPGTPWEGDRPARSAHSPYALAQVWSLQTMDRCSGQFLPYHLLLQSIIRTRVPSLHLFNAPLLSQGWCMHLPRGVSFGLPHQALSQMRMPASGTIAYRLLPISPMLRTYY